MKFTYLKAQRDAVWQPSLKKGTKLKSGLEKQSNNNDASHTSQREQPPQPKQDLLTTQMITNGSDNAETSGAILVDEARSTCNGETPVSPPSLSPALPPPPLKVNLGTNETAKQSKAFVSEKVWKIKHRGPITVPQRYIATKRATEDPEGKTKNSTSALGTEQDASASFVQRIEQAEKSSVVATKKKLQAKPPPEKLHPHERAETIGSNGTTERSVKMVSKALERDYDEKKTSSRVLKDTHKAGRDVYMGTHQRNLSQRVTSSERNMSADTSARARTPSRSLVPRKRPVSSSTESLSKTISQASDLRNESLVQVPCADSLIFKNALLGETREIRPKASKQKSPRRLRIISTAKWDKNETSPTSSKPTSTPNRGHRLKLPNSYAHQTAQPQGPTSRGRRKHAPELTTFKGTRKTTAFRAPSKQQSSISKQPVHSLQPSTNIYSTSVQVRIFFEPINGNTSSSLEAPETTLELQDLANRKPGADEGSVREGVLVKVASQREIEFQSLHSNHFGQASTFDSEATIPPVVLRADLEPYLLTQEQQQEVTLFSQQEASSSAALARFFRLTSEIDLPPPPTVTPREILPRFQPFYRPLALEPSLWQFAIHLMHMAMGDLKKTLIDGQKFQKTQYPFAPVESKVTSHKPRQRKQLKRYNTFHYSLPPSNPRLEKPSSILPSLFCSSCCQNNGSEEAL